MSKSKHEELNALNGLVDLPSVRIQGWTFYGHFSTNGLTYVTVRIGKGKAHTRSFRPVLDSTTLAFNTDTGTAATEAVSALWEKIAETRNAAAAFFDNRGRFTGEVEENPDGGVCVRYTKKVESVDNDRSVIRWDDVRKRIVKLPDEGQFSAEDRESLIKKLRELKKLPRREVQDLPEFTAV